MGAGERSPSAPRLETSIVKEPGDEAPRGKPGETHSPFPLPSGGGLTSSKDLFVSRSLLVESHSPFFAPRSPGFAPSEELVGRHSLRFVSSEGLFASHSPEPERLEGRGMRPEEEGMPSEEEGMGHRKLFASHSPLIA